MKTFNWTPRKVLCHQTACPHALVILNTPINKIQSLFQTHWDQSPLRIAADGGANILHRFDLIPHSIVGDLDSVNKTTLEHFRGKNVEIRYEMDQDSTDFDKALNLTCRKLTDCPDIEVEGILAMCPLHGRLDHIISQMNSAYQYCKQQKYVYPLYMMSQQSLSWVLPPGKHQIDVSNCDSETCGYVPVFGPVSGITTSGLKYEVTNSTMEMGGLISTSNSFVSDKVEITNDHYLLWIMNFETKNVPNCK